MFAENLDIFLLQNQINIKYKSLNNAQGSQKAN